MTRLSPASRRRNSWILIFALIFLAIFLGATGYLLHVRALHLGRLDPIEREVRLLRLKAAEFMDARQLRGEYYLNRFMIDFPRRQADAAAEILSLFSHAGPLTSGARLQIGEAGISLNFLVSWKEGAPADISLRLQDLMQKNPSVLRLDRCAGAQTCLRGLVEVP